MLISDIFILFLAPEKSRFIVHKLFIRMKKYDTIIKVISTIRNLISSSSNNKTSYWGNEYNDVP